MKSTYQKRCLKIALLVWLIPLMIWLTGCGSTKHYKLDCTDYASLAGHKVNEEAWIAIDHRHAQVYVLRDGGKCWLTINRGYLIVDAPREVEEIRATYSLEDWDYMMKNIWSKEVN